MARYDAYLVRVWRGEQQDGRRWACRLEHRPDGRCRRFGSLEELLDGLRHLLATEGADPAEAEAPPARDTTP
ncbi:MAG: hypothetical protein ACRDIE_16350 [Chloroflexota bacterium]